MNLSKAALKKISTEVEIPSDKIFELPEKVLQFGTGVLLRALPDYYIDKANKKGVFNGRVVVVKSTSNGDTKDFENQDCLFTVCEKGIANGNIVEKYIINASISRVLSASAEWEKILECACSKDMRIVISNTTEVGIQLLENDDVNQQPPVSFPGKLLAFLHKRYQVFNGSPESGMVIIPTELIVDNGKKLHDIVLILAKQNGLDDAFIHWLQKHNAFCSSLVDRIVPGKPNAEELGTIAEKFGYTDELYCDSEVFSLWAIEGDEKIKEALSFAQCDENVVIQPDINLFRELKLRLLNATHTFNCGLAFLSDFNLTRDAMQDESYSAYAKQLMNFEIATSIPCEIDGEIKSDFSYKVYERFCNPYINHQWISITAQYTSKMKMRCLPLIKQYYKLFNKVPVSMATGFAGFLLFMKSVKFDNGKYWGEHNGKPYLITDDSAGYFYDCWQKFTPAQLVTEVVNNELLWGADLKSIKGFDLAVTTFLEKMIDEGVVKIIASLEKKTALI